MGVTVMMRRNKNALLVMAVILAVSSLGARTTRADTVDVVHGGYGAYSATTFWAAGYAGDDVMAGVYLLNKTNSTGIGDIWHNGVVPGFCMEIEEPHPTTTLTYNVTMPDSVYNSYLGETLGVTKANYLRELWARYYDPSWAAVGPHTPQQNASAEAFAAAIWEIVYEKLPATPLGWNVTTDGTLGPAGFAATNLDAATANKWLHELTGSGPKADLLAFVNHGGQDYLVAVPEPATIILLGLGGLCSFVARRRRLTSTIAGRAGA
jgi:hypothetical protein